MYPKYVCTYLYLSLFIYAHNYKNPAFIPRLPVLLHCLRVYPILLLFMFVNFISGTGELDFYRLQYIYIFVQFIQSPSHVALFCFCSTLGIQDLGFPTRDRGYSLCIGSRGFNHWTAGKCLCPSFPKVHHLCTGFALWLTPLWSPDNCASSWPHFHVAVSESQAGPLPGAPV